jgi:metal-responsive CopG/Arc/MetJ family transcriptional regulator
LGTSQKENPEEGLVKIKLSIAPSEELLRVVDERAKQQRATRSNVIEAAVQAFVTCADWRAQNGGDCEIINRNADSLSREVRDVLKY